MFVIFCLYEKQCKTFINTALHMYVDVDNLAQACCMYYPLPLPRVGSLVVFGLTAL